MPHEFWAVFETCDARSTRSISSFDCIGTFPTEKEAIECELKNPGYRVRKLIRNTMKTDD